MKKVEILCAIGLLWVALWDWICSIIGSLIAVNLIRTAVLIGICFLPGISTIAAVLFGIIPLIEVAGRAWIILLFGTTALLRTDVLLRIVAPFRIAI